MQLQDFVEDPAVATRMAALTRYGILDTERDAIFDGIAELASALLNAPIAVVNFIADDRQWFKAEIGIGQRELPLDVSICRIALPERGIFVVPDLAGDDRFASNPLVTVVEGLRFYAGMVLESDGVPIGTVCVLDTKPRPEGISPAQRRGLEALALQAMAALERMAASKRDRYRLALNERLRDAHDTDAMMDAATEMLGRHLGVAQVGFAEVEDDQAHVQVHRDWNDGRIPSVVGRWHIDDFGPGLVRDIKAGRTVAITDVTQDARTNAPDVLESYAGLRVRALLNVGLIRNTQMRALLFTHDDRPRGWTADEVGVVNETVERLWSSVERVRAEKRLLQSEVIARAQAAQIEAVYNAAPVGLAVLDRDLRYVNINERLAQINGVPVADHIGRTAREVVPDLYEQSVETFNRVLAGEDVGAVEFVGATAAAPGEVRTWRSNWRPMRGPSGEIAGVVLSAEDITDEKAARDALARSEARVSRAQNYGGIGSWEWDHATGMGMVSASYRALHGLEAGEEPIRAEDLLKVVHRNDRAKFLEAVSTGVATGNQVTVDYRITLPTGEERHLCSTGKRIDAGESVQSAGVVRDVTEATLTAQRLSARDEHVRLALQASRWGSFEWNIREDRIVRPVSNIDVLAETGGAAEGFEAMRARVHPDDLERFESNIRDPWKDRASEYRSEHRYLREGEPPVWVSEVGAFEYDPVTGKPVRLIGMAFDVTQQHEQSDRLRASEELFRTLVEALPSLIFIADANGANTYSNPQFSSYTGLDTDALRGNGWLEVLHPDDRDRATKTWEKSWREGQPYETEYRFRSAGGEYRTFMVRGRPVRDARGAIVQWVGKCTDIEAETVLRNDLAAARASLSEANAGLEAQVATRTRDLVRANRKLQNEIARRKATQAALIQGQKLEALGQLTAGIAHDFNNILSAIAGGMSLIHRRIEDPQVQSIADHCRDAAFRGATLIKQMLAFARQEVLAPSSISLGQLAREITPLIKQAIPGNVVSVDFSADLPPILIDPVLLETALLNLAVNARDAMPGGGVLAIRGVLSRPGDRDHPAELGLVDAVAISVRDNGSGMPPEIVQRVTEPFFTTKGPGAGTGLGLAMVHGFVTQSGGAMRIDSQVGQGTTITLYVPLASASGETAPAPRSNDEDEAQTGVGAVLLVDDDATVRAIAAAQLQDLGYTVTEAAGFHAAKALIEAGEPFDCVVSDVVMPGGDGIDLAAAIRAVRPDLPILFISGQADSARVAGERVLSKPFKLGHLANAVADTIERPYQERRTVEKILARCHSRCVAEMLDHWSAAKFAGKSPDFQTFDPDICSEPHKIAIVKADPSQLPMRIEVVSAGKDLEDLLGRPIESTEFALRGQDGFGSAEESYRRCVKTRLPVFDSMRMDFGDGPPESFERIILPYSSDGRLVDRLVSVVVFAPDVSQETSE